MTHRRLTMAALFLLFLFFLVLNLRWDFNESVKTSSTLGVYSTESFPKNSGVHQVKFFDEEAFNEGIFRVKSTTQGSGYQIKGGIVPHHLLPSFMIADFFSRLSAQKPSTIILLGPNHYERGNFPALTSIYGWETPFGTVNPNKSIIYDLLGDNLAQVDEEVLPEDHSIGGILPFIKYYLPETKVVPILLSRKFIKEESEKLAAHLSKRVGNNIVVVASVDFSHYLTNIQAQEKDEVTLEVMKSFDYRRLYSLNNDYLDSPASIGTLLMTMQKLGTTNMDILYHTNSGKLERDNISPTTSYFSLAFY